MTLNVHLVPRSTPTAARFTELVCCSSRWMMHSGSFSAFGLGPHEDHHIAEERAVLADIERAAALLAQRWKPSLLHVLGAGPCRYNALARRLGAVTPKMLTQQLRALERDGIVRRDVHKGGRKHVEYSLTALGHALRPATEVFATAGHMARQGTAPSESVGRHPLRAD